MLIQHKKPIVHGVLVKLSDISRQVVKPISKHPANIKKSHAMVKEKLLQAQK
jgi:hypothetical protein